MTRNVSFANPFKKKNVPKRRVPKNLCKALGRGITSTGGEDVWGMKAGAMLATLAAPATCLRGALRGALFVDGGAVVTISLNVLEKRRERD
jgi:hypothetical protein